MRNRCSLQKRLVRALRTTEPATRALWALVVVDLVTKVLAYLLLDPDEPARRDALLQFLLATNPELGSWATAAQGGNSLAWIAPGALGHAWAGLVLFAELKRRSRGWRRSGWRVALRALGALIAGTVLGVLFIGSIATWSQFTIMVVVGAGRSCLFLALSRIVPRGPWKVAMTLIAAAAIGNFLSFLYPPHEIVDFIYSAPLSKLLRIGITNLADLYWFAALPLTALAALNSIRLLLSRDARRAPLSSPASDAEAP